METPVKNNVPITEESLADWNRWRGGVDQKFETIIENQRINKELLLELKESNAVQSRATNFARGAMWVVWPLMAFMALLLFNHLMHHSIAVVPEAHAEEAHANP